VFEYCFVENGNVDYWKDGEKGNYDCPEEEFIRVNVAKDIS
jgi:hypothetical protein